MSDNDFMNFIKVNDTITGINSFNSLSLDIRASRSGNVSIRKVKVECSMQTEACKADRAKLRINKNQSTDAQVVFKDLYDHDVYLTLQEQLDDEQLVFHQEKHIRNNNAPVTAEQYENYLFVLPSIHTIADEK